jgi:transcriptional regulator with XRE-family HTH domain
MQYANGSFFDIAYAQLYSRRMTIGDRLDQAMKRAKIESQSELARKSQVPQATISRILKGRGKKGPETETLKKLAAACSVRFEWLNEGVGKPERPRADQAEAPPAANDDNVTADELLEVLNVFKNADPVDREILRHAIKTAAKRIADRLGASASNER